MEEHFPEVCLNEYGYYEIKNKPTQDELDKFYSQQYYQQSEGTYQKMYSDEEKQMIFNKIERKYYIVDHLFDFELENEALSFLDIGCGEGWALSYFNKRGWDVNGIDFSEFGCQNQNPKLVDKLDVGDISLKIKEFISKKLKFDLIQLDNVLEHLLSPAEVIEHVKKLLEPQGVLIIEVPNDFSILQEYLFNNNLIKDKFWIKYPDHLSYFNVKGLVKFMESKNFELVDLSTDFPIDINLLNSDTNYAIDKSKGRNVHFARVAVENLLSEISLEKTIDLYRVLANMDLGRNIIGFFKMKR